MRFWETPVLIPNTILLSFWGKEVPETLVRAKAAGIDLLEMPEVSDPTARRELPKAGSITGVKS